MSDLTVFYAWQSDLHPNIHRYFIRDITKAAVKRISATADVEDSPRLDSDTKNVAGTPEIAATIFGKIDVCGIFLCDVSFIGSSSGSNPNEQKSLPNPNVLLELGYAAARIGWDRVVCVMNTAFGPPDDLPFDLRHRRWPVTYLLPNDATEVTWKRQEQRLAIRIETALKVAMQAEHAATLDVIGRLDVHSLHWMHDFGNADYFRAPERKTMGEVVANQALDSALPRLLALKTLRCDVSSDGKLYAYHWTYLGKLVLRKLGFRAASAAA
jgi:hypothetical protein